MASVFNMFLGTNDEYYFHLKASNGEKILSSHGYKQKNSCEEGIDSVKVNSLHDEYYERKISTGSMPYFVLKAKNGEIIGRSQIYVSPASRDLGIEMVKSEAPVATIEDNC